MIVPTSYWLPIHRAKAPPNPVDVSRFRVMSKVEGGECLLAILIPTGTLTGYEPLEHTRLSLPFVYSDNELVLFSLQHSPLFPVEAAPSLWSVADLIHE